MTDCGKLEDLLKDDTKMSALTAKIAKLDPAMGYQLALVSGTWVSLFCGLLLQSIAFMPTYMEHTYLLWTTHKLHAHHHFAACKTVYSLFVWQVTMRMHITMLPAGTHYPGGVTGGTLVPTHQAAGSPCFLVQTHWSHCR